MKTYFKLLFYILMMEYHLKMMNLLYVSAYLNDYHEIKFDKWTSKIKEIDRSKGFPVK